MKNLGRTGHGRSEQRRESSATGAEVFRAAGLVQQSTGTDVTMRLPHVVVMWCAWVAFFIACKKDGGGNEVVTDRFLLLEAQKNLK